MIITIFLDILPWILFFCFYNPSSNHQIIALLLALVAFSLFNVKSLLRGTIIPIITASFLLFMLISELYFHYQWSSDQLWTMANGLLAVVAWGSLVTKQPFTIQYAKRQVDKSKWDSPLFLKINMIITLVWAINFSLCAGTHFMSGAYVELPRWAVEIVTDSLCVMSVVFSTMFPGWYVKRSVYVS